MCIMLYLTILLSILSSALPYGRQVEETTTHQYYPVMEQSICYNKKGKVLGFHDVICRNGLSPAGPGTRLTHHAKTL